MDESTYRSVGILSTRNTHDLADFSVSVRIVHGVGGARSGLVLHVSALVDASYDLVA